MTKSDLSALFLFILIVFAICYQKGTINHIQKHPSTDTVKVKK